MAKLSPQKLEEEYQKLKDAIGFREKEIIHVNKEKTSYVAAGEMRGQKVLLKAVSIEEEKAKIAGFVKEESAELFLQKTSPNLPRTRVIDTGGNEHLFWIIRDYREGIILSSYSDRKSTSLFGYDILEPRIQKEASKLVSLLKRNISILLDADVSELSQFERRFSLDLKEENLALINKYNEIGLQRVLQFYSHNKTEYERLKQVACVGDLIPANLILSDDELLLSDFEWMCPDNRMYDITYLWLFLWRYPIWQKEIIDNFIETDQDKMIFRMNVIRIIVNCQWHERFFEKNEEGFPWYHYLNRAGESFDLLIESTI